MAASDTKWDRNGALGVKKKEKKGRQPCPQVVYFECHIQVGFAKSLTSFSQWKEPKAEDSKHGQV